MPVRLREAAAPAPRRLPGPHPHKRARHVPGPDPGVDHPALLFLPAPRRSGWAVCARSSGRLGRDARGLCRVVGAGQTAEFEREDHCVVWSL